MSVRKEDYNPEEFFKPREAILPSNVVNSELQGQTFLLLTFPPSLKPTKSSSSAQEQGLKLDEKLESSSVLPSNITSTGILPFSSKISSLDNVSQQNQSNQTWPWGTGGHLAIFIDLAGASRYDNGIDHAPTRYNGVLFHVGLESPLNRQAKLFVERVKWRDGDLRIDPTSLDGNIPDTSLDDFDPNMIRQAYYCGKCRNIGGCAPDAWSQDILASVASPVFQHLCIQPRFADSHFESSLLSHFHSITSMKCDSPELERLLSSCSKSFDRPTPNDYDSSAPSQIWDSTLNCHTFAVTFISKMGLAWPENVPPISTNSNLLFESFLAFFQHWFPTESIKFNMK